MNSDRMLTPEEARDMVLAHIKPLGIERVSLLDATGRVLARDVLARRDNPPHDNSAMDGFAVRYTDVARATAEQPVTLQVVEDIPAGSVPQRELGPGQASRIMTGAIVPTGADAIVPVEDAQSEGDHVAILDVEERGAHIRMRGEDMRADAPVLAAGQVLGPGEISVLATLQQSFVAVYRKPRIAIITTGDELVEIEEEVGPGQIVNGNTAALAAFCRTHGAEPYMLPIARDDRADIRRTVEAALDADFVLSSGGVSVGDYDFVKQVLDEMGAQTIFWRVAMKPGKPLLFCIIGSTPYFGLPGNPVSSMMSFLQFVRPALYKAGGHPASAWPLPQATALLDRAVENDGNRRNYMRCRLYYCSESGALRAEVFAQQGSHMVSSMIGANGIAIFAAEERIEANQPIAVQIIGPIA
jgi:molybdopterin molybdotransferase